MKYTVSAIALIASLSAALPAASQIPVTDALAEAQLTTQNAQMLKDAVLQAKEYIVEAQDAANTLNIYANAVENTVTLPANLIQRVTSLYNRTEALANTATTITGPDGTMMERLKMLRNVGRGAGTLPGSAEMSAEWWNRQWGMQMEENSKLLGLEEERRQVMDDILATAQDSSNDAIGRMQAVQASNQLAASSAMQLQQINEAMRVSFQYTQQKDETLAAKERLHGQWVNADEPAPGKGADF